MIVFMKLSQVNPATFLKNTGINKKIIIKNMQFKKIALLQVACLLSEMFTSYVLKIITSFCFVYV